MAQGDEGQEERTGDSQSKGSQGTSRHQVRENVLTGDHCSPWMQSSVQAHHWPITVRCSLIRDNGPGRRAKAQRTLLGTVYVQARLPLLDSRDDMYSAFSTKSKV